MSYNNCIRVLRVQVIVFLAMIFVMVQSSVAQEAISDTLLPPIEAQQFFDKWVPKKDSAQVSFLKKHKEDKFIKRISIHTNVVDWATLVPNVGIEIDLSDTPRNNYSVSLYGKYNGNATNGSLIYNVGAFRVEGRKYWRTGKYGKKYYSSYERLYTDPSDSIYYNADKYAGTRYYIDTLEIRAHELGIEVPMDSLGVKSSRFRNWFYNTYHKTRRNVFSGRTLENPRNWRAYYFGLWAGYDNWNVSLTGNGKRGNGLGLGILGGYTLPLLPQKYPKEGSLDLDLGIALGVKAVNYDAYTYDPAREEGQRYVENPAKSTKSWKVVPFPVIQDIHVSLIWRFRGIKNKVDKSLIDDYEQKVSEYSARHNAEYNRRIDIVRERENLMARLNAKTSFLSDSTAFWNEFHLRRIENAKRLNPDTVLTDADQYLYLKITENLDSTAAKKRLLEYKDSVVIAAEKAEKQHVKDSILNARQAAKDSILNARQAYKDSVLRVKQEKEDRKKFLKDSLKASKEKVADTLKVSVDSLQMQTEVLTDSVVAVKDSVGTVLDAKAAKKAEKAAQKAEKERLAQEKDSIAAAEKAAKKAEKESKKKDKKKKEKSDTPQDAEAAEKGSKESVATEPKED